MSTWQGEVTISKTWLAEVEAKDEDEAHDKLKNLTVDQLDQMDGSPVEETEVEEIDCIADCDEEEEEV